MELNQEDHRSMLSIRGIEVEDTYAEAFPLACARAIVTAENPRLVLSAAQAATGNASSVIGCDCEAGIDGILAPDETPDGRPGASLLFFGYSRPSLELSLVSRIGQGILPCPTTAVYNGLPIDPAKCLQVGGKIRFFGDGWQISKLLDNRRYWRIPVMDGEFVVEEVFGAGKGVAGGNLIIQGETRDITLQAAEKAAEAMGAVEGVILPFAHGIVRAGSKVGSRYPKLKASTNQAFCPSLRGRVKSELHPGAAVAYELVVDGLDLAGVEQSMRVGMDAAAVPGVVRISAGNYGGKLGPFLIHLKDLLPGGA